MGGQALAHGHHSHGKPLTALEQKAAEGEFDDKDVKARELSDWDGMWQSIYPYLLYESAGYKILTYASGKKGVRYLFECKDASSSAPKFVQFSDHTIAPRKSAHFHIFMGNTSQEALLKEMDNWPTYYPYQLSKEQVVDEMLHH